MDIKLTVKKRFFNDVYYPYLKRDARFNVYYGSAGSGKSRFVAQKLILKMLQDKRHKLLVVRDTLNSHQDSTFNELVQVLEQYQIRNHCAITKMPLSITLPNGAKIIFRGADDESKLLSISGISLVWVEEASDVAKDIFEQLTLRLRGKGLKKEFYLTFNPVSEDSWLKTYFFDQPPADTIVLKTTFKDNRFLDEDYLQGLEHMRKTNPRKYRVFGLGDWGTLGETIYENWEERAFDRQLMAQRYKMLVGMDFGFTADPTALVQSFVDEENKTIYVSSGFYDTGLLNQDIHANIRSMGLLKSEIFADSADPKTIAELKRLGVRRIEGAKKGPDSIRSGIAKIQEYRLIVHPELDWFINELKNYSYKKDRVSGNYTNEPIDRFNHALDAFRYSIQSLSQHERRIKSVSKRKFGF